MYKIKKCKICEEEFKQYSSLENKCFYCKKEKKTVQKKKYKIPPISKKRKIENAKYLVLRAEFLGKKENSICPVTGKKATEIHHKKGRVGSLFLDVRYWLGVSREGHKLIEENPEWAKEKGYSLNRLN